MTKKERRRYRRWQLRVPVRFKVQGKPQVFTGSLSRDVSAGGIRVLTDQFLPKDTPLEVELFLEPFKRLIPARARVVWLEQVPYRDDAYQMGLEFSYIEPAHRNDIMRLAEVYGKN